MYSYNLTIHHYSQQKYLFNERLRKNIIWKVPVGKCVKFQTFVKMRKVCEALRISCFCNTSCYENYFCGIFFVLIY